MIFIKKYPGTDPKHVVLDIDNKCSFCKTVSNISDITDMRPNIKEYRSINKFDKEELFRHYQFMYTCPYCKRDDSVSERNANKIFKHLNSIGFTPLEWYEFYTKTHELSILSTTRDFEEVINLHKKHEGFNFDDLNDRIKQIIDEGLSGKYTDTDMPLMNEFVHLLQGAQFRKVSVLSDVDTAIGFASHDPAMLHMTKYDNILKIDISDDRQLCLALKYSYNGFGEIIQAYIKRKERRS